MQIDCNIDTLRKEDFQRVVSLIMKTSPLSYTSILNYIKKHHNTIYVYRKDDQVEGVFAYTVQPNHYVINFFSLGDKLKKTKAGYCFFCKCIDMLGNKSIYTLTYQYNHMAVKVLNKIGIMKYNIFDKKEDLILFEISREKVCK